MLQALMTKMVIIFYALAYKVSYTPNLECINPAAWDIDKREITSI